MGDSVSGGQCVRSWQALLAMRFHDQDCGNKAAQERGEVHNHGGQGKRDVLNGDIPSTTDLGLRRAIRRLMAAHCRGFHGTARLIRHD